MAEGIYPPGDATMAALELWTVAHGVAALLISRPYLPFGDVEEFADRVMRSACCRAHRDGDRWDSTYRRRRPSHD